MLFSPLSTSYYLLSTAFTYFPLCAQCPLWFKAFAFALSCPYLLSPINCFKPLDSRSKDLWNDEGRGSDSFTAGMTGPGGLFGFAFALSCPYLLSPIHCFEPLDSRSKDLGNNGTGRLVWLCFSRPYLLATIYFLLLLPTSLCALSVLCGSRLLLLPFLAPIYYLLSTALSHWIPDQKTSGMTGPGLVWLCFSCPYLLATIYFLLLLPTSLYALRALFGSRLLLLVFSRFCLFTSYYSLLLAFTCPYLLSTSHCSYPLLFAVTFYFQFPSTCLIFK